MCWGWCASVFPLGMCVGAQDLSYKGTEVEQTQLLP